MPRRSCLLAVVAAGAIGVGCAHSRGASPVAVPPQETAMVPIVENWALVEGRAELYQAAEQEAQARLTVRIERVSTVERAPGSPYPHFLDGREGSTIVVSLPAPAAAKLAGASGHVVRLRVRRGARQDVFFAHPDDVAILR
jgi:hypothetical protein